MTRAEQDRADLNAALALVRKHRPEAVAVSLMTSDQKLYGFVLTAVEDKSGETIEHSWGDDLWPDEVETEISDLLGDLAWDGVVGESEQGYATIPIPSVTET